ncbi:uncharacterized protein MYCFIDRAFT_210951 [Pseudocercospora fijiensis CIRAD86]|uniref:NAD(P)-binding domain-containing protein n=1 Tax=Pseudocercospora fijiensis (strain CIRAD86) TaxID=383855 RepID=M3A0M9_PSEFD|nr:uncharacterized protein MYCFIDRAFT_210951 [Pseudocercospora fijiensis CIRAD86]EME84704.1 hypothetical protein MYCFIDRAFT_210951 [Pseudocercospora fijiensis CIRAD86]
MSDVLQNIAFIGATGNLGRHTLKALVDQAKQNITLISRSKPKDIPTSDNIKIHVGQYDDEVFLQQALAGQDLLIIMLAFTGLGVQDKLVEVAARAGVKYIMPSTYGMDMSNPKLYNTMPLAKKSAAMNDKIKQLGMKPIGVVTNLWIDYSIEFGLAGFDVEKRQATIYSDSGHFCTSSLAQVGRGIAAMLALPRSTIDERFADNDLYITSFRITHQEWFDAILKATNTTEADWNVERKSTDVLLEDGNAMLAKGDRSGMLDLIYYCTFKKDLGGDYAGRLDNDFLELPEEDIVEVIRTQLAKPGQGKPDFV